MTVRTSAAAALLLAAAALLPAPAAPLHAQTIGASAGLAMPVGGLAEHRGPGYRVQGSVTSSAGWLRGDVAGTFISGSDDSAADPWYSGDWRSVSVAGNLLPLLGRSETTTVRGLVGLSTHRSSIPGVRNTYGAVPGAQLGGVLERRVGPGTLTLESGLHAVASDFGVEELHGAFFVPVIAGLRF